MEIYIVKYFFSDNTHIVLGTYTDREDARNCVKHYVKEDEETIIKTLEGLSYDWYEVNEDEYYEISSLSVDEIIYDENGDEIAEDEDEDEDEDDFFCQGECTTCPNIEECYGAEDDPEQDDDEDEEEDDDEEEDEKDEDNDEDNLFDMFLNALFGAIYRGEL